MKNQVFSLTDYKGKNIVLVFYIGDSCLPCFQQLGELQNHLAEIRALDAEVIAIASHGQQDVANTQSALNIEFVLVPGPQVALMKQFGVYNQQRQRANPATFIIDKAGLIRWKYVGGNDYDRPARSTILTPTTSLQCADQICTRRTAASGHE
jgi:peroxiredoxin